VRSVTASNQTPGLPSGTSRRRLQSGRPMSVLCAVPKDCDRTLSTFLLILLTVCLVFVSARCRQQVWYMSTKLHGATSQKTMFISTLWELYRKLLPSSVSKVAFGSTTVFFAVRWVALLSTHSLLVVVKVQAQSCNFTCHERVGGVEVKPHSFPTYSLDVGGCAVLGPGHGRKKSPVIIDWYAEHALEPI